MSIEVIPVRDGDVEYVKANCVQVEVKDYPELVIPKDTYTCIFEGKIVAVGGIKVFFEGVGEAWIMMTEQCRKDGIFGMIACNAIEAKLNSLAAELGMRRVEANVRKTFAKAIRFTEALGFQLVGERKQWFPNGDSSMLYSKVYK